MLHLIHIIYFHKETYIYQTLIVYTFGINRYITHINGIVIHYGIVMNNLTRTYAIHIVAVDFLPSVFCPMDSFVFSHTLWIAQVISVRFVAFLCAIGAIRNMVLSIDETLIWV